METADITRDRGCFVKKKGDGIAISSEWVKNGRRTVRIKTMHGQFNYEAQRLKSRETGEEKTDLELMGEFDQDYISSGLRELIGYYSNQLSYEEVSKLVSRQSGQQLLSDQKIEEMVIEQGRAISEATVAELARAEQKEKALPEINKEVDVYSAAVEETLLLADGIQVKEQAATRQKRDDKVQEKGKKQSSFAQTNLVMLAKAGGGYEYISELIPSETHPDGYLAEQVRQRIIAEYGKRDTPLNLVAITDGATVLRHLLMTIFGCVITIILDWYHLEKKTSQLMSMIAQNKSDKEKHLPILLAYLWQGKTGEAITYLQNLVPRNADKKQELLTYLEKHRPEIIDYQRRQQAGKVIGSGRMEKGCDLVIGHRQKKKGMSWSLIGSRSLALLKVAQLNNRWQQLWFSQPALAQV